MPDAVTHVAEPRRGVLEGLSRILRELLRTPRFKQNVRILLREFDPENAGLVVRACREEDPELFLSALATTPALTNAAAEAARELLTQLLAFPPELIASFLTEIVRELDARRLGEAAGLLVVLLAREAAASHEALTAGLGRLGADFAAGVNATTKDDQAAVDTLRAAALTAALRGAQALAAHLGAEAERAGSPTQNAVAALAEGIRAIGRDNPAFMRHVVAPLVAAGRDALAAAEKGDEHD